MSLDIHQQKISVGVYQGNYSEKKKEKNDMAWLHTVLPKK
jgi:hypothetical protein